MKKNSTKTTLFGWLAVILFVVCVFLVVSIVLACVHNQPIVTEWKSWFNIVEDAKNVQATLFMK